MSRADDLAAKAARLRARNAQQAPVLPEPAAEQEAPQEEADVRTSVPTEVSTSVAKSAPALPPAVRSKPVRMTVDLAPADHSDLSQLLLRAAGALGVARVSGQEVTSALIRRLLADPDLEQKVLSDVAEKRQRDRLR